MKIIKLNQSNEQRAKLSNIETEYYFFKKAFERVEEIFTNEDSKKAIIHGQAFRDKWLATQHLRSYKVEINRKEYEVFLEKNPNQGKAQVLAFAAKFGKSIKKGDFLWSAGIKSEKK